MILITRPKNQSILISSKLQSIGLNIFNESLYTIKYRKKKLTFNENEYYIFPSINTLHSLIQNNQINKFKSAKIFVVGKKVNKFAKKLGFSNIIAVEDDSNSLINIINDPIYINQKFTYLSSNLSNEDFLKKIKKINIKFKREIIYETQPANLLSEKVINLMKKNQLSAAVFYSQLS